MTRVGASILGALTFLPFVGWAFIIVRIMQSPGDTAALESDPSGPLPSWMWAMLLTVWLTIGLIIYYLFHLYKRSGLSGGERALWLFLIVFGNVLAMPLYWLMYVWSRRNMAAARG
jgi:hypothetical protein